MEYQALHTDPWLHGAFWVFVAIVVFAIFAGSKIVNVIANMLDSRSEAIRLALGEAERLKAEAAAMLEDAKQAQTRAVAEAKEILNSAAQEAAYMAAELASDAQASAARRERLAMERIAAAEKTAVQEVRAVAIDIATAAATRALAASSGDTALIDRAIAGVPQAIRQ
jgi:F-type H+-transporting ATPase subunit b